MRLGVRMRLAALSPSVPSRSFRGRVSHALERPSAGGVDHRKSARADYGGDVDSAVFLLDDTQWLQTALGRHDPDCRCELGGNRTVVGRVFRGERMNPVVFESVRSCRADESTIVASSPRHPIG